MNFVQMMTFLERGGKAARLGWPNRNRFVFLVPGSTFVVNRPPLLGIYPEGTEVKYRPHVDMRHDDGTIGPWQADIADVMGTDWYEVDL